MAGGMVSVACLATFLVRPGAPRAAGKRRSPGALEARVEPARGRSRKSKDIRQPSFGSGAGLMIPEDSESGVGSYGTLTASPSSGAASAVGSMPIAGPSSAR